MTTQAWVFMDADQKADVDELYDTEESGNVIPVVIDNPLANQLGLGDIDNDHWVAPARLLNDADYVRYHSLCSTFPIHTWDSDVLFVPLDIEI